MRAAEKAKKQVPMEFGKEDVRWVSQASEGVLTALYFRGERVLSVNNAMFYAYGGARLTIRGMATNIKIVGNYFPFSFDVKAKVTIDDTYTFEEGGLRAWYSPVWAAGAFLEHRRNYNKFDDTFEFEKTYSVFRGKGGAPGGGMYVKWVDPTYKT
jgi:hypothetical protein